MKYLIILCLLCVLFEINSGHQNRWLKFKDQTKINLHQFAGITEQLFIHEYNNYLSTGVKSITLEDLYETLKPPIEARRREVSDIPELKQTTLCALCRSIVGVLIDLRKDGMDDMSIKGIALDLCKSLQLQADDVCDGLIELNFQSFLYIFDNRQNLTSDVVCGLILQGGNCMVTNYDKLEWKVNVDKKGTAIKGHKGGQLDREENDLKIIHLTDAHYDPLYKIGANAKCFDPICCRRGEPASEDLAAKKWGDYRDCDSPWDTVMNIVEHIKNEHADADFLYYTGDIIDHAVWETSVQNNSKSITKIYEKFAEVFGDLPLYPILGNHEPQPVNQFAPKGVPDQFSPQWLYDLVANLWSKWLPEDALETVRIGGYYTVLVKPGFRIIALNNNDCYTYNWWLFYEPQSPAAQVQWLHDTLLQAEKNKEKVHILAHVPSGEGSCMKIWAREYRRVIDRFWDTISGIFNGHTHYDELNLYYAKSNSKYAINVAWNGGSATPFSDVNHNYHLLYVDTDTLQVTDYDNWIFNLTEANLTPDKSPRWFKSYTFREEYGVSSTTPAGIHDMVQDFAKNPTKLKTYFENKYKLGDPSLARGCNEDCLSSHLCEIVTTEHGDTQKCNQLLNVLEQNFIH